MCGRASYSARAVAVTQEALIAIAPFDSTSQQLEHEPHGANHSNMGPGTSCHVFRRSPQSGAIECPSLTWGLLPQHGSRQSPHILPDDPHFRASPHFAMFNARSETLFEKRSFRRPMQHGQTCVLAVEGYYEWIDSHSTVDRRKQPYFVRREDKTPLLLAGLWACVNTGKNNDNDNEETISTFAILTRDAPSSLAWLHPRQPVILWTHSIACKWLLEPSPEALTSIIIDTQTDSLEGSINSTQLLSVYPVTKKINDGKYQGEESMTPIKLGNTASVKDFFTKRETSSQGNRDKMKLTVVSSQHIDVGSTSVASWECASCTFVHIGESRSQYLACEVCGSAREAYTTAKHEADYSDGKSSHKKRKA